MDYTYIYFVYVLIILLLTSALYFQVKKQPDTEKILANVSLSLVSSSIFIAVMVTIFLTRLYACKVPTSGKNFEKITEVFVLIYTTSLLVFFIQITTSEEFKSLPQNSRTLCTIMLSLLIPVGFLFTGWRIYNDIKPVVASRAPKSSHKPVMVELQPVGK